MESRSDSGVAEGTIRPCRFVKAGTDEGRVLEADAGEMALGISFKGTRRSDYVDTTAAPGILANSGEPLSWYTAGSRCQLEIAGTIAFGGLIKSDADGKGVASSSDGEIYGARALADGVSGEVIPVEVITGIRGV